MNFDDYLNNFYAVKVACDPDAVWPIEEYDPFTYSDEAKTILTGVKEGVVLEGEVVIPNRVVSIGTSAFNGCSGLTSITIPDSVRSIEQSTFYNCSSLTSVTIGNSVASIESSAFSGCTNISSVVWDAVKCSGWNSSSTPPFSSAKDNITSFTFGDKVDSIPSYLCYGMSKLISITIPNSVTSIGGYAFSGCTGLTSITIPNGVTSIGEYTFYNCTFAKANFINNSSATGYPWGATITE